VSDQALVRIDGHERECAIRQEAIDEKFASIDDRLSRGSDRMARIEGLVWTLFPFIVGCIYLSKDL